jgi:hypothetical protein
MRLMSVNIDWPREGREGAANPALSSCDERAH